MIILFQIAITIPNSVKTIAFEECCSLTKIVIPNNVTNIDCGTFHSCNSLTFVNIPNIITTIKVSTFAECSSLEEILIPESVTYIDDAAFFLMLQYQTI